MKEKSVSRKMKGWDVTIFDNYKFYLWSFLLFVLTISVLTVNDYYTDNKELNINSFDKYVKTSESVDLEKQDFELIAKSLLFVVDKTDSNKDLFEEGFFTNYEEYSSEKERALFNNSVLKEEYNHFLKSSYFLEYDDQYIITNPNGLISQFLIKDDTLLPLILNNMDKALGLLKDEVFNKTVNFNGNSIVVDKGVDFLSIAYLDNNKLPYKLIIMKDNGLVFYSNRLVIDDIFGSQMAGSYSLLYLDYWINNYLEKYNINVLLIELASLSLVAIAFLILFYFVKDVVIYYVSKSSKNKAFKNSYLNLFIGVIVLCFIILCGINFLFSKQMNIFYLIEKSIVAEEQNTVDVVKDFESTLRSYQELKGDTVDIKDEDNLSDPYFAEIIEKMYTTKDYYLNSLSDYKLIKLNDDYIMSRYDDNTVVFYSIDYDASKFIDKIMSGDVNNIGDVIFGNDKKYIFEYSLDSALNTLSSFKIFSYDYSFYYEYDDNKKRLIYVDVENFYNFKIDNVDKNAIIMLLTIFLIILYYYTNSGFVKFKRRQLRLYKRLNKGLYKKNRP